MTASALTKTGRPRRKAGRPTKLTPAIQEAICTKLRAGNVPETAAISEGVARRTFFLWLERGKNGEQPYEDFRLAVDQAIAEFEVKVVAGAVSDPKNSIAILERRFPDRWSLKREQVNVQVNLSAIMESPDWQRLRDDLVRSLAAYPDALATALRVMAGDSVNGEVIEEAEIREIESGESK